MMSVNSASGMPRVACSVATPPETVYRMPETRLKVLQSKLSCKWWEVELRREAGNYKCSLLRGGKIRCRLFRGHPLQSDNSDDPILIQSAFAVN